jgi:hypothetical protein
MYKSPRQNVLVTRTQVKTLYEQQTSLIQSNTETNLDLRNTSLGYGLHFQHRNPRTLPVGDLMIVNAPWYMLDTFIRRDLQIPSVKKEIQRYSSQYSPPPLLRAPPNDLIANLVELPGNRGLRRHLPTRFLA